jgi:hypothetical protein
MVEWRIQARERLLLTGVLGLNSTSCFGPTNSMTRPVRIRMPRRVGLGGEEPPATRLGGILAFT